MPISHPAGLEISERSTLAPNSPHQALNGDTVGDCLKQFQY
jgi:hypothetical protein